MIPMTPATMQAAAEAYRKQARFHNVVRAIVAEEMGLASRALDEAMRDPYNIRQTVDYIATSVAARVLQTVYDNDREIAEWKAQAERMVAAAEKLSALKPMPPVLFNKRDSHETYVDGDVCLCRHCGQRWRQGDPEPPLPCMWPVIQP